MIVGPQKSHVTETLPRVKDLSSLRVKRSKGAEVSMPEDLAKLYQSLQVEYAKRTVALASAAHRPSSGGNSCRRRPCSGSPAACSGWAAAWAGR